MLTATALFACAIPAVSAEETAVPDATPADEAPAYIDLSAVPDNIRFLLDTDEPSGGAQTYSADANSAASALRVVDTDDRNSIRIEDGEGNGTAHIFATPVRYETDEGEIEFIDTSMTQESFVTSLFSGYDYRNAANSFTLRFSKQPATGLNMDGDFTMAVDGVSLPKGTADQTPEGNGRITYPETFGEHTYLEYINTPTGVKENIVLEQNIGKNRFDFVFASDTHQPVLSEDGSTLFIVRKDDPEQQAEYTVSPLYVYDSCMIDTESEPPASGHKHFTEDCHYELTPLEDGSYRITSVVSEEFLNDPETTYPVIIDPTISNGASYVSDTYVSEAEPGKSFGSVDHLRFGNTGGKLMHTLIRFDNLMQSIPINAVINSASIKFTFRSGQTTGSTGALWRVTEYWLENTPFSSKPSNASWTNYDASSERNYVNGYIDNYNFNVTSLVQKWLNSTYPYYGVYLTYTKHAVPDYNSVVSSDGETHRAPTLTVNYAVHSPEPYGIHFSSTYFIRNYNSGLYLQAGSNGTVLTQRTFTGNPDQQWKMVHHGSGWVSFYPLINTSLRIDLPNSNDENGQELHMAGSDNGSNQQFRILRNSDGTYRIQPYNSYISRNLPGASTNMAMEVTGASSADGAEVQIWSYYDSESQMKWVFEEVESGNYSRGISSTPIHPGRQAAWELSESEYDCWPALEKSNYYGWDTLARDAALAAINTTALAQAAGVNFIFPNGSDMLFHYLFERKTTYTVDFKYINNNWDFAESQRNKWINETLDAAETLGVQGKTVVFHSKSEESNVPPDSSLNDFILCFNKYYSHITCSVAKTNSSYSATIYYYMEDIYDWDPTSTNKVGLISQRDLWELHHGGFCKAYKVTGMNTLKITWTEGQRIGSGASIQDIS